MNPPNNIQIENKHSLENSNECDDLLNNMKINSTNNNSLSNEISLLKKEMEELKEQHDKDKETLKKEFGDEINLLKEQINNLRNELNELKNKKNKNKNNINNINNINNDIGSDSENVMEEEDQTYSIESLSSRLNTEILQGTERANIDIVVRNNSNMKYPKNTFLICDNKNSLLLCEKVELNELEPREQQKVSFIFKNLKLISKGNYKCFVKLMANNKKCSSTLELSVDVLENRQNYPKNNYQVPSFPINNQMPNMNMGMNMIDSNNIDSMVNNFKIQFELYNNELITDERIKNLLIKNNFDFNKTFESLFI